MTENNETSFPDAMMRMHLLLFHFISLRSGILELRHFHIWYAIFEKFQDGGLMLIFVPKLDIFTFKSLVTVVRLPKSSETLNWDNIILPRMFVAMAYLTRSSEVIKGRTFPELLPFYRYMNMSIPM